MSPLLDLQRRMAEVGRIRIGHQVQTKSGKMAPAKLDRFRITSRSRDLVDSVAAVYGGDASEWRTGPKEPVQWEVYTDTDALNIIVAPGQTLTAWYEMWSGGGCQRRCDGYTEQLTDGPCMCPAEPEERRTLAQKGQACWPTTRLSVMLRDVPAIGLWRLESRGHYAAVELSGTAELLQHATARGIYIPATLRLDQRTSKKDGQTLRYAVPMIVIDASFAQVSAALGTIPTAGEIAAHPPALPAAREGSPPPAPSRAALPAAPKGRQKPAELPATRPALPEDPTFKVINQSTGFTEPATIPPSTEPPDDSAVVRAKQIAISAHNSDVPDDLMRDMVDMVTDGRTRSRREVTDKEASELHSLFSRHRRGKNEYSYDEDGRLVVREP